MAGLNIGIKDNIKAVSKQLTNIQREQIPFATAQALTNTAWNSKLFAQAGMVRDMEKPKPFTLNAFKIGRATKRNPTAYIEIKPTQWDYLQWVVVGGTKRAETHPLSIPYARKRVTKRAYNKMIARPDTFNGIVKGIHGIWERIGRHRVKLLFAFEQTADYKPESWTYLEDIERAVEARFPYHFNQAIIKAIGK